MKSLRRAIDATIGAWTRHVVFMIARSYLALRFNISCSGKHLIQDLPGGLILASHVSRFDGPLVVAALYSSRRVRPAVHYDEYHNHLQKVPMLLVNAVPMSSPKSWSAERRAAQKDWALNIMRRIIANQNFVLLFPAGRVKRTPRETIEPHFSGAYETLKAIPDCPVVMVRIQGLSKFDKPVRDQFWYWTRLLPGRRHITLTLELIENGLDTAVPLEIFNRDLEERLNAGPAWPQIEASSDEGGLPL
ncbi:MAG: 1-acyl-sn-glycerol-3-phosphate acyltransferase [Marinovum sp.]|nr:1-acyl-sn-glycerol-3-phosphate acyltransferase [Marinovum sp.]